jgi:hypothetical protein
VVQTWHNCRAATIDARAYDGELIEAEGDVVPGMTFRDGRFWSAPPRVEAAAIRAEAARRIDRVFPSPVQDLIAVQGGPVVSAMLGYIRGVHARESELLAMDSAPANYADDRSWPVVPDMRASPVPLVIPPTSDVQRLAIEVHTMEPVEPPRPMPTAVAVRPVIVENSHNPEPPRPMPVAVARPAMVEISHHSAPDLDLEPFRRAVVGTIASVVEASPGMPDAIKRALAEIAAEATAATTVAGIAAARDRARAIVEG